MAFPGIPVEVAKHRGHPLKSFSIPAPPSNTPLIPNSKPGNSSKHFLNSFQIKKI